MIHPGYAGTSGMKRSSFMACLAFLLLLLLAGVASAVPVETTERPGGNIYFDSSPAGATIWLDNVSIGMTPFTYYTEKTGMMQVRVEKRLFEDYLGNVTVNTGDRVRFYALLTPVPSAMPAGETPVVVVTTATVVEKNAAVTVPTPWPTSTPESPVNPVACLGAVALASGLVLYRRR
jgi:hypothetical protein